MTCLETSFLIDLLRDDESARDLAAAIDEAGDRPSVTPVAAAEVWVGAQLGSAAERNATAELLESLTWLEFTRESARSAGEISAEMRRGGNTIAFTDCLIAAVAIEYGETLVTRDAHFERIRGLEVRTY